MTAPTRICKDCGSTVVRFTCQISYVYPDGINWLCCGACDKTGYGCGKPTSRTLEKSAQGRLPLNGGR